MSSVIVLLFYLLDLIKCSHVTWRLSLLSGSVPMSFFSLSWLEIDSRSDMYDEQHLASNVV